MDPLRKTRNIHTEQYISTGYASRLTVKVGISGFIWEVQEIIICLHHFILKEARMEGRLKQKRWEVTA